MSECRGIDIHVLCGYNSSMADSNLNGGVAGRTIRRKFSRIDEKVPLRYRIRELDDSKGLEMDQRVSINIGGGGLLFSIDEPVAISTVMDIEIDLPGSPIPLSAVSRVVRIEEATGGKRYDVGLEFVEICDEDRKVLEEFIRERLKIDIRFEDVDDDKTITVVRLEGFLDTGTVPFFENSVNVLMSEGRNKIVLDCAGLHYINSDGIMVFLSTANEMRDKGGGLKLIRVNEEIANVLNILEVTRFLDIFDTEKDALKSFGPPEIPPRPPL